MAMSASNAALVVRSAEQCGIAWLPSPYLLAGPSERGTPPVISRLRHTSTRAPRTTTVVGLAAAGISATLVAPAAAAAPHVGSASAPGKPTITNTVVGDQQIKLVWSRPADTGGQNIVDYPIRYSTTGGAPWTAGPKVADTVRTIKGLQNCTGYVFEVAADNGSQTGPYSEPTAVLTPHGGGDATALATNAPARVGYAKKATFTATLTDAADHSAITGATVELVGADSTPAAFGTATTNAHGVARTAMRLRANTSARWVYDGSSGHVCSTSDPSTVTVSQLVQASLTAKHVKTGKRVSVYGTVRPQARGQAVTLQRKVAGHWKKVGHHAKIQRQRLPDGKKVVGFVLAYRPHTTGRQVLRVSRVKTSANAAGVSKPLRLKVS
jgi:hypothetical protein